MNTEWLFFARINALEKPRGRQKRADSAEESCYAAAQIWNIINISYVL
jgi:hypothetical protein